jgi:hypothetical protein
MADLNNIMEEGGLSEDRGPAKGEAYGMGAVMSIFKGVQFPADKRTLLEKVGKEKKIPWTKEHTIDLREVIENAPQDRFNSITELTRSVSESAKKSV